MSTFKTKTMEEWIIQGKQNQKDYVFFNGYCLDLSSFKRIHPGGHQVISTYRYKDVTNILFTVFPHNQHTTPKILQKYRIGLLNQTPAQKTKIQGTILKQRNNQKDFSTKKQVKFSSDVKHQPSQKQKVEEQKQNKLKNSKVNMKNSTVNNSNIAEDKKSKRAKNINQDYLDALKGTVKSSKSIQKIQISQHQIKSDHKLTKIDSGSIKSQKSVDVSIKKNLKNSETPIMDFIDEYIPAIKVPILNVRLDRIW